MKKVILVVGVFLLFMCAVFYSGWKVGKVKGETEAIKHCIVIDSIRNAHFERMRQVDKVNNEWGDALADLEDELDRISNK